MKTIEEQAREYAYEMVGSGSPAMDVYIPHDIIGIFLDGAEAATRWISVEEGLPELHDTVVTMSEKGMCLASMREDGLFERFDFNIIIQPTHWLPIPPIPEK